MASVVVGWPVMTASPTGAYREVRHDSDSMRSIAWPPKWQPSEPTTVDGYGPAERDLESGSSLFSVVPPS